MTYKDPQHVLLTVEGQKGEHEIPLNVPVQLGPDRFIVEPRAHFASPWKHETITVQRYPVSDIARYYQHTIEVTQAESKASSLTLSLRDRTKERALDILKAQVAAYNQEEVEMRGQIAINTTNFINERIAILTKELGIVENEMEDFLVKNRTLDFEGKVGQYNVRSLDSEVKVVELQSQLRLVSYMLSYLNSPQKQTEYLPLNIGISDPNLDTYIAKYNQIKSDRDRLVKASEGSVANPVIAEYDQALAQIRKEATEGLNQYAVALNTPSERYPGDTVLAHLSAP